LRDARNATLDLDGEVGAVAGAVGEEEEEEEGGEVGVVDGVEGWDLMVDLVSGLISQGDSDTLDKNTDECCQHQINNLHIRSLFL
jgi:hypothetical protein